MHKFLFVFLSCLLWVSCYEEPTEETLQVWGNKPIYLESGNLGTASTELPKAFGNLGKIVSNGSAIYINEVAEGIHVIDNNDPNNPITKHFWSIPGNIDFTIKDQYLYADSNTDLLTIDISNPSDIKLVSTIKEIYKENPESDFPLNYRGHFECVDSSKGFVIGWEEQLITNPKCRI